MTATPRPASFMRWDPATKERHIYSSLEAVPAGFLDHHPDDPAHAAPAAKPAAPAPAAAKPAAKTTKAAKLGNAAAPTDMTPKEVADALTEGGVTFNPDDDFAALHALLTEKVKAVLTEQGVKFDPAASTKTLLGLLSPGE